MERKVDHSTTGPLVYELEYASCNLCGSEDHVHFLKGVKEQYNGFDEYFDIVRCRDCGFLFTNPRPTVKSMHVFYPDSAEYFRPDQTVKVEQEKERDPGLKEIIDNSILANWFGYPLPGIPFGLDLPLYLLRRRKIIRSHYPRYTGSGRLFDVGCSWGKYLAHMKGHGWNVSGVDANETATRYAREKLGLINIKTGSYEDVEFPEGSFDAVNMSMFLEHVHHPGAVLAKSNRCLADGGQLILSVPDVSGWESAIFGRYSFTLQVPQHLSHFTPETIRRFLTRNGFTVERILHYAVVRDVTRSARNRNSQGMYRFLNFSPVRNQILKPVLGLLALTGHSGRMTVVAKKVGDPVA